jgi:hypothetical protein
VTRIVFWDSSSEEYSPFVGPPKMSSSAGTTTAKPRAKRSGYCEASLFVAYPPIE